ncbi:flagellar biosynthesis protein FlhA [Vulgatibacter sp.]|uniref:flagellar biosynthesis protein FlhA n=1 Tax=Vulgatibacter sp. TaxID=1971226 RepID=UPI0035676107
MAATAQGARGTGETLAAMAVLAVLAILILPVPAAALDGLLAFNVGISVMMLLVALGIRQPLDFSVFPSLLLISTLFRLGLNVATTRLILLDGGKGAGAAGGVIEAFGRFVVGGSLVVGLVIFLILLVVNFVVITKGSGRVSEVAARFTLDAMPGKQMAIDADLAAGIIDDREARTRRTRLEQESEFFGAMDGASKFVRGDAIAGLFITVINVIGGLLTGLFRDGLSLASAVETYTLLTVGDGLVSQMPALLVSTAAGIVVTRADGDDLGTQVGSQVLGNPRVLHSTAAVLGALALLPGLPFLAFGSLAAGALVLARRARARADAGQARPSKQEGPPPGDRIQDLLAVDALELQVGYGLLASIDVEKGGELPGRITALRRKLAEELGVVFPSIHLRDDLRLDANEYRVLLRGLEIGAGKAWPDRLMALDPRGGTPSIEGIAGREPAFGLPAIWIRAGDRPRAETMGLTLVDVPSVVTTHLGELLRRHAHELVGRQEVQEMLGACAREAPKLVEDVVPGTVTLGEVVRVIRSLVREGLSVRDMRTILEAIADAAPRSKDNAWMVEQVRRRLARQITSRLRDEAGKVRALTLDRTTEDLLRASLGNADGEAALAPDVATARKLIEALESNAATLAAAGRTPVLLAPPDLRRPLFDFVSRFVPDMQVISARELLAGTAVEPAGQIQLPGRSAA